MAARNGNLVFILIWRELLLGGKPEGLPAKSVRQSIPRAAFLLGQKVALLLSFRDASQSGVSHVRRLLVEQEIYQLVFCIDSDIFELAKERVKLKKMAYGAFRHIFPDG
jgi:hypothetical protein